jgi:hypothetical protein
LIVSITGKCPVSGCLLNLGDLIPVRVDVDSIPRVSPVTSIPDMLLLLRNE